MGYTNYWKVDVTAKEGRYKKALQDIRKVIKEHRDILANGLGDKGTSPKTRGEVAFNGIEDQSHETFFLPSSVKKFDFDFNDGQSFDFCKTAFKEYDKVVVACLCILKFHLGSSIDISSDGDAEDLAEGVEIASKVLGVTLLNPFNK